MLSLNVLPLPLVWVLRNSTPTISVLLVAVQLHLKESGHSFEDSQARVLKRDRWFERGVKEAIHVPLLLLLTAFLFSRVAVFHFNLFFVSSIC